MIINTVDLGDHLNSELLSLHVSFINFLGTEHLSREPNTGLIAISCGKIGVRCLLHLSHVSGDTEVVVCNGNGYFLISDEHQLEN